jgi:very-short-patch-repair endonuclease
MLSQGRGKLRGMNEDIDAREVVKQDFDGRLLELAGRQHYVVAREQLREFGTLRQIEHRLAKGRLERVHEGVYRVVGSPKTWQQRLLAACLASSGANAVSFRAAARMCDLPGGEEIVEVTAPRHRRMQLDDVTTHESFFLTDLDVTCLDGIPVTRPARLLCDLALLVERGELRACTYELAVQEAIRRNLVDVERLWREWERLGGEWRPGGRTVAAVLNNYVQPIRQPDTRPESRLLQIIRTEGLPEPVAQFRVALSPTRNARLDFAWPDAKVYCEFDPYKWHGGRDRYMADATRRLRLEMLGWRGVPVTDDELDSGGRLATQLLLQRLPRAG